MDKTLRERREALFLTQEKLAHAIGCTKQTVGAWELSGKIKLRWLGRLAELEEAAGLVPSRAPGRPRSAYTPLRRQLDRDTDSVIYRHPDTRDALAAPPRVAGAPWYEHAWGKDNYYLCVRDADDGPERVIEILDYRNNLYWQPSAYDLENRPRPRPKRELRDAVIDTHRIHGVPIPESD